MNKSESLKVVSLLQAAYPRDMSAETVALYASELMPFQFDDAVKKLRGIIRTNKWLPSIAELIERLAPEAEDLTPTPDQAWNIVSMAAGACGANRFPNFDCSVLRDAVHSFGWQRICQGDELWVGKEFRAFYADFRASALRNARAIDPTRGIEPPKVPQLGGDVQNEDGFSFVPEEEARGFVANLVSRIGGRK